METRQEILSNLPYYTGTTNWFQSTFATVLYTDGVKYLAEAGEAYWLIDAIGSHIVGKEETHPFVAVTLDTDVNIAVAGSTGAVLTFDDGNGNVFAKQVIEYTDFPLHEITLYAVWDGSVWVVMLTSEY
ncbi:DUF6876 family protein [Cupriavidus necator]